MEEILKGESFAVIIAIEDYRFSDKKNGINPVKYARNDAQNFKQLLIDDFAIPEKNITYWIDEDANKSALENELKYLIKNLTAEDNFFFYYAGHGFYKDGHNKLSCWDTHINNLNDTTISIKDVLLDPLFASECKHNLIFLDCCSSPLLEKSASRDLLANFNTEELESFFSNVNNYTAIFMSCSPGEKSYPHEILKHGIWTWHLINALKGDIPEAISKDEYITDRSLQDYLSYAVPQYITKSTEIRDSQNPYSKIQAKNTFLIRKIQKKEINDNNDFPQLSIDYSSAKFISINREKVKNALGFKGHHFVPDSVNATTRRFVQEIFEEEINEDVQAIYEKVKNILSLKRRDIDYAAGAGSGYLNNKFFRYKITIDQYKDDPSLATIKRELELRVSKSELPLTFGGIFPKHFKIIKFKLNNGNIDFLDLVDQFENLKENEGGELKDNELKDYIKYQPYKNFEITVLPSQNKVLVKNIVGDISFMEFIELAFKQLSYISKNPVKL